MSTAGLRARQSIVALSLIWIGMLLGVSFLATPVKFLAPSLSLSVALDVGRQTFHAFSIVEIGMSLSMLAAAALLGRTLRVTLLAAMVGSLVAVQFLLLLPALDARVEIILQGGMPEDSALHTIYIAIEAAKIALLGVVAWWAGPAHPRSTSPNA